MSFLAETEAPRSFRRHCEKVFEAYRELIEQVASAAFDAEVSVDETGCVLVTKELLDRVRRSA
jgi:hypothetical protein